MNIKDFLIDNYIYIIIVIILIIITIIGFLADKKKNSKKEENNNNSIQNGFVPQTPTNQAPPMYYQPVAPDNVMNNQTSNQPNIPVNQNNNQMNYNMNEPLGNAIPNVITPSVDPLVNNQAVNQTSFFNQTPDQTNQTIPSDINNITNQNVVQPDMIQPIINQNQIPTPIPNNNINNQIPTPMPMNPTPNIGPQPLPATNQNYPMNEMNNNTAMPQDANSIPVNFVYGNGQNPNNNQMM